MSRHIDAVTSLIDQVLDVGQQHTDEASYGDDHGPGRCWRCPAPADDDSTSGLCAGCRSFLLEDSDDDPAERGRGVRPGGDLLALSGYQLGPVPEIHWCFPGRCQCGRHRSEPQADERTVWRGHDGQFYRQPWGREVETPDGIVVERTGDIAAMRVYEDGSRWTVRTALNDGSGAEVSTVFLVIDHNHGFGLDDPGIWYETMVFGGSLDGHQWRYSTRADAEAGHQRVCAMDHTGEPADEAVF